MGSEFHSLNRSGRLFCLQSVSHDGCSLSSGSSIFLICLIWWVTDTWRLLVVSNLSEQMIQDVGIKPSSPLLESFALTLRPPVSDFPARSTLGDVVVTWLVHALTYTCFIREGKLLKV